MAASPEVTVSYYALLRSVRGLAEETIHLEAQETGRSLYQRLQKANDFPLAEHQVRLAINDNFVPMETPLNHRDHVVFIPPVQGG